MSPAEAIAPLQRLRGLARQLAGQDADDLLQDVAIQAVRYSNRIDPATHRGWLARVMYHRATRGRRFRSLDGVPEPVAADDPYWSVRLAEVDAFLGRMAAQDRAALLEAADGKPVGNPRSFAAQRVARARRQLHAAFGETV